MGVRTNSLPGRESVTFLRTDREPLAPREQGHAAKNTVGERARPAALEWKLDRPELADSHRSPRSPIAAVGRPGSFREWQLTGAVANSHNRPAADACSVRMVRPSSGQFGGSALRVAIVDRRAP